MFTLVLPCCDKTNEVSRVLATQACASDDKEKAYIHFNWTMNTFIESVLWWTNPPKDLEGHSTWKPKLVCDDWEHEYVVPSMNFYDTSFMTQEYLIYNCEFNNHVLASEDGAFEIRFKRKKAVPFLIKTPYASHDVRYNVTVTIPYKELPEAAKVLAESNLEKKKESENEAKRRAAIKRKADELRAMAAELEAELGREPKQQCASN